MTSSELQSVKNRFGIIGNSPLLNHALQVAVQVAPTEMTVLITGESGVGKESFSKVIHALSPRRHGQFIAINCGAIPEGTIDSELFGHEKGAFTGATESRKGYFEVTDGGSIFLDEIGELPLGTQARLLRVLENGEFIRVGSSKVQKTDVRVVTATNVRLFDAVQNGKFREDLYYRLSTVPIVVPPLRERGDDVPLLFRKFAVDFSEKYHRKAVTLTPDGMQEIQRFRFPGNIRQLKNLVEQLSVLEYEREISAAILRRYLPPDQASNLPMVLPGAQDGRGSSGAPFERELLYSVLFEMRRDVNDLKGLVGELLAHGSTAGGTLPPDLLQRNRQLLERLPVGSTADGAGAPEALTFLRHGGFTSPPAHPGASLLVPPFVVGGADDTATVETESETEDVAHTEAEEENFSLDALEKAMIIKALRRHQNRRKHAAQDLGISERTLYRKLKQYDIEQ
ncbi:MAG: sigma-54-dependent Fis family transcriptional regulator [Hymenobacteraceae bacterium]|nr:sigma-54-dependent Fis family transcriptional regulator [Hymenobacteraceae bacterium]